VKGSNARLGSSPSPSAKNSYIVARRWLLVARKKRNKEKRTWGLVSCTLSPAGRGIG